FSFFLFAFRLDPKKRNARSAMLHSLTLLPNDERGRGNRPGFRADLLQRRPRPPRERELWTEVLAPVDDGGRTDEVAASSVSQSRFCALHARDSVGMLDFLLAARCLGPSGGPPRDGLSVRSDVRSADASPHSMLRRGAPALSRFRSPRRKGRDRRAARRGPGDRSGRPSLQGLRSLRPARPLPPVRVP